MLSVDVHYLDERSRTSTGDALILEYALSVSVPTYRTSGACATPYSADMSSLVCGLSLVPAITISYALAHPPLESQYDNSTSKIRCVRITHDLEHSVAFKPQYMRISLIWCCLLYTSPSPRDATLSRMPSSA